MQIAWWRSKICPQARRRGVRGVQTNPLWRSICQFIWRPPPEDNAIAKFALRNGIVLLWVDNSVAHVVAPVYPSDLVICSQNNPHHWRCFLYRRSGFDKWKTKGGEYDLGGHGWYVFNTYWLLALLSVQRQRSRGTVGLKLLPRDTLQHTSSEKREKRPPLFSGLPPNPLPLLL